MQCKLTTQQLIAYLDGDADSSVNEHVDRCQTCQRKARELANAQQRFVAKLKGNQCPSTMHLGEYHLRHSAERDRQRIREHIRGCSSCLNKLNGMADEIGHASGYHAQTPSHIDKASFGKTRYNLSHKVLYPQPGSTGMAQGIRGAASESTMNYSFGAGTVSLRLHKDNDGTTVTGLIMGLEPTFNRVRLLTADNSRAVGETDINRLGGFTLSTQSGGDYEIALEAVDGVAIVLREVNL